LAAPAAWFQPGGRHFSAGVRKPPDCVFSIGLLIVEVEEVGRVAYSVHGLTFTNHQSPIINYQLSIINYQLSIINYQLSITPRIFNSFQSRLN
jgi:hypothetical protein